MNIVEFDTGTIFSGGPTGNMVWGWDVPCEYTPVADPNYQFPTWAVDIVLWFRHSKEALYLFGPTGCGKTSCIKQVVCRANYPVYEVTGHSRLEFPELVGHHTVQQGSMKFEYGPLARAMKGGGLFLLNEIDLLDPATAAGLNSVLDGYPLTIAENGGELIKPHPLFKMAVTANSNGGSDQTGLYQGVLRQNIAFMDRFMLAEANYLGKEVEEGLLNHAFPVLGSAVVQKMVLYADAVRKQFIGDASEGMDAPIEVTFSTRTLLRWAFLMQCCEGLKTKGINVAEYTLDRALLYRASKPTQVFLRELFQRIFGGER